MKNFALTILTCLLHFNLFCMEIDSIEIDNQEEKAQNQIIGYKDEWKQILNALRDGTTYTNKDANQCCVALPENAIQQIFDYAFYNPESNNILYRQVSVPCTNSLINCTKWNNCFAYSSDHKQFACVSGTNNNNITIHNSQTGTITTLNGHKRCIHSISFSPDDKELASSSDRAINIWNLQTGAVIKTIQSSLNAADDLISYSDNGKTLIRGLSNKCPQHLNLRYLQKLQKILQKNEDNLLKPIEKIKLFVLTKYLQEHPNKQLTFRDVDGDEIDPILN